MRASRMLFILTTLQARGRVTAQALADECEVTVRTIYRDVDALSAAGVPVYSDRGSAGGYRLLDGYRTRLNGLSRQEAEALFLLGLSGPAAALGLHSALAAAALKLTAALPADLRTAAERMGTCFHLDAPGWFQEAEEPACLRQVAGAVWEQRMVAIRYRSWKAHVERRVAPLGLVLKGGAWYLVANGGGSVRTYRIGRIRDLAVLNEGFERPAEFELAAYWRESTRRLEAEMHTGTATVRLSPAGVRMLAPFLSPFARAAMRMEAPDDDGYRVVTLPVGSVGHACSDFLRFGGEIEVLAPAEIRARMGEIVAGLGRAYENQAGGAAPAPPQPPAPI